MLGDAHALGDVAQSAVYQPHPGKGWRLAANSDAELLIDDDFPDLLRQFVALGLVLGGGGAEHLYRFQDLGIGGLGPDLTVGGVPARQIDAEHPVADIHWQHEMRI